jgi:NAD(P)-dependent dehydrogenase (short-subunit alcohol dehydrogenase family)
MTAQPASALVPILAQHIKGKTILVLGASPNSLGARFLEAIKPAEPGLVILGLRNETKAKEVASTLSPIPTRTFPVDFASFANVRTAAQQVLAMDDQIDVLVNNIGTMASPYYKTEDGFESQLQLNHLSFFLFTNLIMDKLIASKTRIVNITSEGYSLGGIRYHDWNFHVSTAAVSTSTHGRLRL